MTPETAALEPTVQVVPPVMEDETETTELLMAAEGYAKTREAFPFINCRFTITKGSAASVADALAGKLRNESRADVRWVVRGDQVKFDKQVPRWVVEDARAKLPPDSKGFSVPFFSQSYLADGMRYLTYTPLLAAANVHSPDAASYGVEETPFDMGMMGRAECLSPYALIRRCVDRRLYCRLDGNELIGDMPVLTFRVGETPKAGAYKYSLAPDRGFLPWRIYLSDEKSGRLLATAYLTDARDCGNGRWFPERSVTVNEPARGGMYGVREIRVVSLDIEHAASDSDLSIELPAGTAVVNPADMVSSVTLERSREVRPSELKDLLDRTTGAVSSRVLNANASAGSATRWRVLGMTSLCVFVLLVASVVYRYLRRRDVTE
jgi:hypothetical protein